MRNIVFWWMAWGISVLVLAGCAPRGRTSEAVGQARQAALRGAPAVIVQGSPPEEEEVAQAAQMLQEPSDCPVKGGCDHSLCEQGKRLDPACDPCAEAVCAADSTCCAESWDEDCVKAAGWLCGACGSEGCGDLPAEGACLGDFAVRCEGSEIVSQDCAESGLVCGWAARGVEAGCLAAK